MLVSRCIVKQSGEKWSQHNSPKWLIFCEMEFSILFQVVNRLAACRNGLLCTACDNDYVEGVFEKFKSKSAVHWFIVTFKFDTVLLPHLFAVLTRFPFGTWSIAITSTNAINLSSFFSFVIKHFQFSSVWFTFLAFVCFDTPHQGSIISCVCVCAFALNRNCSNRVEEGKKSIVECM